jgi:hypothetical protein
MAVLAKVSHLIGKFCMVLIILQMAVKFSSRVHCFLFVKKSSKSAEVFG